MSFCQFFQLQKMLNMKISSLKIAKNSFFVSFLIAKKIINMKISSLKLQKMTKILYFAGEIPRITSQK